MTDRFADRVRRLQGSMGEAGTDAVLLGAGPDLEYFTGYAPEPSERLTMLVVPGDSAPTLFVPRLEAPKVADGPFELISWGETEDPLRRVAGAVQEALTIAIGDHAWSAFLLGLQERLPSVAWQPASKLTSKLRAVKDAAELATLQEAAGAVDRVLARLPAELAFEGRTEREVARDLARMTVEEGHDVSGFTIVAAGPNGASPHHEASDRVIEAGDLVVCDFGGRRRGYFSDVTRTFCVGMPSSRQQEIHGLVEAANAAGRRAVAPGVPCQEVDRAARGVIEAAGLGEFFIHRTGHGIGLEVHEQPYLVEGNEEHLALGMTFSVEPGVYLPGEFGVRIEDIVTCSEAGVLELNQANRALVVVG